MKQRNVAVRRRNSSCGIVHHSSPVVGGHLRVSVARVERRISIRIVSSRLHGSRGRGIVVMVVGEVLVSSDTVLGVVGRITGSYGFTTSFCRGDRRRDDESKHQTEIDIKITSKISPTVYSPY